VIITVIITIILIATNDSSIFDSIAMQSIVFFKEQHKINAVDMKRKRLVVYQCIGPQFIVVVSENIA